MSAFGGWITGWSLTYKFRSVSPIQQYPNCFNIYLKWNSYYYPDDQHDTNLHTMHTESFHRTWGFPRLDRVAHKCSIFLWSSGCTHCWCLQSLYSEGNNKEIVWRVSSNKWIINQSKKYTFESWEKKIMCYTEVCTYIKIS